MSIRDTDPVVVPGGPEPDANMAPGQCPVHRPTVADAQPTNVIMSAETSRPDVDLNIADDERACLVRDVLLLEPCYLFNQPELAEPESLAMLNRLEKAICEFAQFVEPGVAHDHPDGLHPSQCPHCCQRVANALGGNLAEIRSFQDRTIVRDPNVESEIESPSI